MKIKKEQPEKKKRGAASLAVRKARQLGEGKTERHCGKNSGSIGGS